MNRLLTFLLVLLTIACTIQSTDQGWKKESVNQKARASIKNQTDSTKTDSNGSTESLIFANGPSHVTMELTEETVVIIEMDSLEIKQLKALYGEDQFYTAADDLIWYNSQMERKMDSLGVGIKYTEKDSVDLVFNDKKLSVTKDSSFSLFTYFHFNGKEIKRTEVLKLLGYQ